ncbi:hypothetical protein B0H14DRAFT_2607892, partial [Mycena olivaceomarginata]
CQPKKARALHTNTAVKKADKDKEKLKKKDKVASEHEVVQEIEYEDNGNGSDDDNSKPAKKKPTKKVVMVTAAPKAGLSGSPNIAIAKKAQHAPVHNGEKLPYEVWPAYA